MAMGFILAVAADREIGLMRQRGKQLDGVSIVRRCHLRAVLPDECRPLCWRPCLMREFHGR